MRDEYERRMPAQKAKASVPCAVERHKGILCRRMIDCPAEYAAGKNDRRIRKNGEIIRRNRREIVPSHKEEDRAENIFGVVGAARIGRNDRKCAVADLYIRIQREQNDEEGDADRPGNIAQYFFRGARPFSFTQKRTYGGYGVI